MEKELLVRAAEIMSQAPTAVIGVTDESGFPRVSSISSLKTKGTEHAWFATGLSTGKVRSLKLNNKAGVCYHDEHNNVTLMGTVEILTDLDTRKTFWVDWFKDHFPGGIDDPEYCILKFTSEKAVFWIDGVYKEMDL